MEEDVSEHLIAAAVDIYSTHQNIRFGMDTPAPVCEASDRVYLSAAYFLINRFENAMR